MSSSDSSLELEQPLLANGADYDGFSGAGIWSRLTFGWLSPLFEKGRSERLELSHVPRVPRSESAKASFCLLQESLRKRKAESSSFQRAIVHSVRRCLALNAIFAGIQKICIPSNRSAFSLFKLNLTPCCYFFRDQHALFLPRPFPHRQPRGLHLRQ